MSRKYTAKELNYILKSILGNAYEYMEAIIEDIKKIPNVESEPLQSESQSKLRLLNMHLTIINDIVHPGHKLSYKYFTKYAPMLDWYQKNQQLAFEKKIVPACFALCCDPDGIKTAQKAEEMRKKVAEYDALQKPDLTDVH